MQADTKILTTSRIFEKIQQQIIQIEFLISTGCSGLL